MSTFPYVQFRKSRQSDQEMTEGWNLPTLSAELEGSRRGNRDESSHGKNFRLLDKGRAAKGIVRFGLPQGGWYMYWTDIFHTLLNMPRYRFLIVFFSVYLSEYLIFALLYLSQPDECVGGVMRFSHALWFSVYTAATLGYTGDLSPKPDCTSVNVLVIFQVITAALIDYCMMGLVFARFASPNRRAFTIRFSSSAVLFQRPEDGLWCLSFRLANIRKHSLINPQISLMLALPVEGRGQRAAASAADPHSTGSWAHFRFQELAIEDLASQVANLRLGLHAHINHIIRPGSPLYDASLDDLGGLGAEVLCFMEGVDPMTSNNIQARHSYTPSDIRMNERFVPIELKLRKGELGLDFSGFDATTERALQAGGAEDVHGDGFATFLMPMPNAAAAAANGPNGASGPNGVPLSTLATSNGGANGVGAGGLHTAVAMGPDTGAMLAAAMSGDLRTHMQQLRSQSIRSLTTPLPAPALVPSVSGSGGSFALMPQHVAVAAGTHPLGGGSRLGTAGGGVPAVGASGTEMRDLCDAVLTDVGCSPAVKRQAAALKEALMAMELMPRGPADLAGRPLL